MTREEALKEFIGYTTYDIQPSVEATKMAIEALKQEPCEDAISRQAVDEYITNLLSGYLYDEERTRLEDLLAFVWELPSVTPKFTDAEIQKMQELEQAEIEKAYELGRAEQPKTVHWIPVSERLPEENDYRPSYMNDVAVLWCTDKGKIGLGWFYDSTKEWANMNDEWDVSEGKIIAWMPLPEPYKKEG